MIVPIDSANPPAGAGNRLTPMPLRCCAVDSLANDHPDESRVPDKIPAPHSARLTHQSIKPFEPGALHPSRRANRKPAYVVEASSYAEREANAAALKLRGYPFLLGRRAHCYE